MTFKVTCRFCKKTIELPRKVSLPYICSACRLAGHMKKYTKVRKTPKTKKKAIPSRYPTFEESIEKEGVKL